jgi:hypothetical protein
MTKEDLLAAYEQAGKDLHFLISRGIIQGPEFNRLQKILKFFMEELAKYEEEE